MLCALLQGQPGRDGIPGARGEKGDMGPLGMRGPKVGWPLRLLVLSWPGPALAWRGSDSPPHPHRVTGA